MVTLNNLKQYDEHILDPVVMPEGLDSDVMRSVMMMRLGLCYPVYDEPEVFKSMLETWFSAHRWNIEHLIAANNHVYDPLENYDREEDFTDKKTGSHDSEEERDLHESSTGTATTGASDSATTENEVSAYNTTGYDNDTKTTTSGSSSSNTTNGSDTDNTGTVTNSGSMSEDSTHTGRIHGNIGVTTSQQMFQSEIDLVSGYNIYYTICNWIERDLFLQIY